MKWDWGEFSIFFIFEDVTTFSEEETNAFVHGRIHDLEFQILFTIDGVNFYYFCYWLDHYYVTYNLKDLSMMITAQTTLDFQILGFIKTLSERWIGVSWILYSQQILEFIWKTWFKLKGMFWSALIQMEWRNQWHHMSLLMIYCSDQKGLCQNWTAITGNESHLS